MIWGEYNPADIAFIIDEFGFVAVNYGSSARLIVLDGKFHS